MLAMVQLRMDIDSYQDFEIGKILRMIINLIKINNDEPEEKEAKELSEEEFERMMGFSI